MEFVLLEDTRDMEALAGPSHAGALSNAPSRHLDSRPQLVMALRGVSRATQLFLHELTHAATALCFPGGGPWLHEGLAGFYETARIRSGELVLGVPPYGFVRMDNVEPTYDVYPVYVRGAEVWILPLRLLPEFEDLRAMDADEFYAPSRGHSIVELQRMTANYAGAWSAVHLLQFGDPSLAGRFSTYLTRLAQGEDDDVAWGQVFAGIDMASRHRTYVEKDYKIGSRPVVLAPVREPSVHPMSQVDTALLWSRLYGWGSEPEAQAAREYFDFAASQEPDDIGLMLHLAAFHVDEGRLEEGERWLERALERPPNDPQVLATAILWVAGTGEQESRRDELEAWGTALRGSAQTAFHFVELGEYELWVARDPAAALEQLNKSIALDATSWRTYELAGRALEELGRPVPAIRAYYTAIALTAHEPSQLREDLKTRIRRLEAQRPADAEPRVLSVPAATR
jgi:tetratricopeptide (TPR) repeat protein